jgi:hypothetical protein
MKNFSEQWKALKTRKVLMNQRYPRLQGIAYNQVDRSLQGLPTE